MREEQRASDASTILFEEASVERIEAQDAEALLLPIFREERPPRGLLGAVDWRFGGRISRLIKEGLISTERGALSILPARRRLPSVDKLLIAGMGSADDFNEAGLGSILDELATRIKPLSIRSLGIALPGRSLGLVAPAAAFEGLLQSASSPLALDLVVYDEREAVREMESILATAKRRDRAHYFEG